MKRLIFIFILLIFLISGCTSSSEKSELIHYGEEKLEDINKENNFDKNRWDVDTNCQHGGFWTCPEGGAYPIIEYIHREDEKLFIDFYYEIEAQKFDKYDIVRRYIIEYVFNDYIFDIEKGNDLASFFKKMDDYGIKDYISKITWNNSTYPEYSSVCSENDVTKEEIEELSKEYYDSSRITVRFEYLKSNVYIVDSEYFYSVSQYPGDEEFTYTDDTLDSDDDYGVLGDWSDRYNF